MASDTKFVTAALGLSFASLVTAHVFHIRNIKNGFLPFKAAVILLFYFGLSALGRIWAIIVFVTPSLGLFDTMFHAWFGRLEPGPDVLYDFFPNGTDIQMADAWKPFQFSPFDTVFYSVPLWSTLPLLVALHVLIQLAIAKKFKTHPAKEARHWHVLYNLVCPPLF